MRRSLPLALALVALTCVPTTLARAESVVMTIDRATTLNFMRAATPYTFEASFAGLTERFTFYNPRELRFEAGKIRLKVDCRGEPISVMAELEPTMIIYFDRQKNAFVAKAESLPVKVGTFGTIYLDRYLDPIVLPSSFSNTLEDGIPGLLIETVIRDLKVLPDRIEARADLVFRKTPPEVLTSELGADGR